MKVVNAHAGLAANVEVLQVLREKKKLNEFEQQLVKYLDAHTDPELLKHGRAKALSDAMAKYRLLPAERMQILNHQPTAEVELHLIIEECPERFQPEETAQILASIDSVLHRKGTRLHQSSAETSSVMSAAEKYEAVATSAVHWNGVQRIMQPEWQIVCPQRSQCFEIADQVRLVLGLIES
eukprot:TRINITY_DN3394_c0_g1_i3.p1 TRINITY_DN3394_c0_g1~~TRINITY_DN3394_c0_g1_i3.p1  ORF type:complete len:191 (-),score=61.67 TRINITY_DN3394_c0_g1_i3:87-629(-)